MANILDDLKYRNLIKDFSNEEEMYELLNSPQTIYCGFDPSASSMHVGNYVMISLLKRLQNAGHRIIAVVGGATGMIGDPSGKSKERNLQDKDTLLRNTNAIKAQLEKFIDLSDPSKGILVNNYDWLSKLSLLDMLRDYGKHFSINYLLSKDIIASRLESGISYTEFSYNILQAIDFLYLYQNYNCRIQIGGSDQWGNLTSGLELIRKFEGSDAKASVMTCHLIVRSDGKKFGKSEQGALFLNKDLTSPYQLYQYFYNTTDEDACKYLKIFTFLSKDEIEAITKNHLENLGARIAQKALAYEIVKDIHSKEDADEAVKMSEALFSNNVTSLNEEQLKEVFNGLTFNIDSDSINIVDALITCNLASSKREARQFLVSNAVSVNSNKISDETYILDKDKALYNKYYVIRRGKKLYALLVLK